MSEHVLAFREAMEAAGLRTRDKIVADGEMHRFHVEGDSPGRRNGWYILFVDDHPAGMFGSWKHLGDDKVTWTGKGTKSLTAEDRAKFRDRIEREREASQKATEARQAAAAAKAREIWEAAQAAPEDAQHPYLTRKQARAYGLRTGRWVHDLPPDRRTGEIREIVVENALLVPMWAAKDELANVQAILPGPVKFGREERDKDFLFGGRKRGCYLPIVRTSQQAMKDAEGGGDQFLIFCEGYATGATIHEATGQDVIVCFDAGNLGPVLERFRKKLPRVKFIIAADNDRWTKKPDGTPWNTGVEKAMAAAGWVGATVVIPEFADLSTKPTDFNDLRVLAGLDAVRDQVFPVHRAPPVETAAPVATVTAEEPPAEPAVLVMEPPSNLPFEMLGFDRESFYFRVSEEGMVDWHRKTGWTAQDFAHLAHLDWWIANGFGKKGDIDLLMAYEYIKGLAHRAGFYDPSRVRGCGAWRDGDHLVIHLGDRLIVDGQPIQGMKVPGSSYIYDRRPVMNARTGTPMSDADGARIVAMAGLFSWSKPASALLLSGWAALAPICGALMWRPHIWITGGAGSGKTTIQRDFIEFLSNGTLISAQGNSTEPGIRQALQSDARPVALDEAEQNNEKEAGRMQGIVALARQASSESQAKTFKGTTHGKAMYFQVRSMFCFSSIQVGLVQQADMERIAVLGLRSKRSDTPAENERYRQHGLRVMEGLADLGTDPELPARLFRRSLDLLPVTLQNVGVFALAAAKRFGSARHGDQYGALLAGAWSLTSSKVATQEEALALIDAYEWGDFMESTETEESTKALSALMGRHIRAPKVGDVAVYELVSRALNRETEGMSDLGIKEADALLRRHGLMLKDGALLVANRAQALRGLMDGTPYAADLRGQLLRVPGVCAHQPQENFAGEKSRATLIPLSLALDGILPLAGADIDDELDI